MFSDRLQIGRVIELVSDLQGEGQAPAGKCTVSYLHISKWMTRWQRWWKKEKENTVAEREKRGVSAVFNCPLLPASLSPVQWSSTAESLHESVQTTCLLINLRNIQFGRLLITSPMKKIILLFNSFLYSLQD